MKHLPVEDCYIPWKIRFEVLQAGPCLSLPLYQTANGLHTLPPRTLRLGERMPAQQQNVDHRCDMLCHWPFIHTDEDLRGLVVHVLYTHSITAGTVDFSAPSSHA